MKCFEKRAALESISSSTAWGDWVENNLTRWQK